MLTVGGVVSRYTCAEAKAVHPFAPVIVTEYAFAEVALMTDVVAPVLHRYVPVPTAVKLAVGLAQVNVALPGVTLTMGGVISRATCIDAVAVQPLAPVNVTE